MSPHDAIEAILEAQGAVDVEANEDPERKGLHRKRKRPAFKSELSEENVEMRDFKPLVEEQLYAREDVVKMQIAEDEKLALAMAEGSSSSSSSSDYSAEAAGEEKKANPDNL